MLKLKVTFIVFKMNYIYKNLDGTISKLPWTYFIIYFYYAITFM